MVEDDRDISHLLEVHLLGCAFTVDIVSNGIEGFERACKNDYQLVVLDLVLLPGLDGLELYLLDPMGQVVAHSMPPDKVKRKWVSLQPTQTFLAGEDHSLIMGDDPSYADRLNSFTVAPIDFGNQCQGYIYAILGSEKINHITDVLQRSLIMKWSASTIFIVLALEPTHSTSPSSVYRALKL